MSDLIVAAIKIVFLILLWLFIFFVADVVRTDMFGRKVPASSIPKSAARTRRGKKLTIPTRFAVTHGPQQGMSIPADETINLGRASDSSFMLDDDFSSVRHAQLVRRDRETWVITDLKSTNGTYVNGSRITEPTVIGVDDVVRIGTTVMRLEA